MAWFEPIVTALAIHGAVLGTAPHVRIALAIDPRLPAPVSRHAVAEAAAIWAPYGVHISSIDAAAPCGVLDAVDTVLAVRLAGRGGRPAVWSSPFGSIRFLPDGRPEPAILVHDEAITTLALKEVVVNGAREGQWPRALRDQVYGRIVGRVIAHEIGHWLLSRDHSPEGLMRGAQNRQELASPGREGFTLGATDIARLRAALGLRVGSAGH